MNTYLKAVSVCVVFFYIFLPVVRADEVPVHMAITVSSAAAALDKSPGFASFLNAIANDLSVTNATNYMVQGSAREDDPVNKSDTRDAGQYRSMNHFYDPLDVMYGKGLSDSPAVQRTSILGYGGVEGINSFAWGSLSNRVGISTSLNHPQPTNGEFFPVVTLQTTSGRFSSAGGWDFGSLLSYTNWAQVNVQPPVTQVSVISITDPVDIKWTAAGNLYVLSGSSATITEFNTNGTSIRSLSGIGSSPSGLDVDAAGNVYVAVTGSNQVWRFKPTSNSFTIDTNFGTNGCIGLASGASGTNSGQFNAPFDVAISPDGSTISVSDSGNNQIQQFDTNGNFAAMFGGAGTNLGQFNTPKGLTYDSICFLYIVDSGNNRLQLAQETAVLGATGSSGTNLVQFAQPVNVSIGERGVYVADTWNGRLQAFNLLENGTYALGPSDCRYAFATNSVHPYAVAAADNLTNELFYIADPTNNRVILYKVPSDDPTVMWTNMASRIAAGDISGAITNFSSESAEAYRQTFLCLGTNTLISDIGGIGTLTPVFIKSDSAEYYFQHTFDGQSFLFTVEFIRENGFWKIFQF